MRRKLLFSVLVLVLVVTMVGYAPVSGANKEKEKDEDIEEIIEYEYEYEDDGDFLVDSDYVKEDNAKPSAGVSIDITGSVKKKVVINDVKYTRYVTTVINVRTEPNIYCDVLGKYVPGDGITITGEVENNDFVRIFYKGQDAFVHSEYLSETMPKEFVWNGPTINRWCGTVHGPSGKETYYNLPMNGVVQLMRSLGYSNKHWVRADGCHMFGDYIMLATDVHRWPKGTILQTSLGLGMICDHCGSASSYSGRWIDIAVNW